MVDISNGKDVVEWKCLLILPISYKDLYFCLPWSMYCTLGGTETQLYQLNSSSENIKYVASAKYNYVYHRPNTTVFLSKMGLNKKIKNACPTIVIIVNYFLGRYGVSIYTMKTYLFNV